MIGRYRRELSVALAYILLLAFLGPRYGVSMATIGIFVASVEISGGMRKVRQAFDPMFTPIIARQSAVQDRLAMQESFAQLGRWVLAAQLPLMGVLCLAGGIGLDIFGPKFRGGELWVALLAIAQMPPGVPVACVGVYNARNAAVLAARILG